MTRRERPIAGDGMRRKHGSPIVTGDDPLLGGGRARPRLEALAPSDGRCRPHAGHGAATRQRRCVATGNRAVLAALRDRKDDLAELRAGLESLVCPRRVGEGKHAVHVDPGSARPDELVRALEVRGQAHRRAVDDELLPPQSIEARRWAVPRRRPADDDAPFVARRARDRSQVASPTVSTTTSAPRPPVASFTACDDVAVAWVTTTSAPSASPARASRGSRT